MNKNILQEVCDASISKINMSFDVPAECLFNGVRLKSALLNSDFHRRLKASPNSSSSLSILRDFGLISGDFLTFMEYGIRCNGRNMNLYISHKDKQIPLFTTSSENNRSPLQLNIDGLFEICGVEYKEEKIEIDIFA